ncbi:MAG: acetyl-CoA carboxylase biotin carboxyl carrier protein subunit, partial [Thermoprotei archaeon]
LESMKMELEIRAGRSGKVKEVLVKEGDSVRTGQPIIALE